MKTKVEILYKPDQCSLDKGDIGYIDGYQTAADGRPYAVVAVPGKCMDFIQLSGLKPIGFMDDYSKESPEPIDLSLYQEKVTL